MGESQSRYSIVERLTKQKLNIMGSKASLKSKVTIAKQEHENYESEMEVMKEEHKQEYNSNVKKIDFELTKIKQRAKNLAERKKDEEELLDSQIKAIDEALKQIEDISKSQSTDVKN